MVKFFVAVILFSFQIVFPMELAQFRQKPPLPKLAQVNFALLRFDQIRTWCQARSLACQHSVERQLLPNMLIIRDVALLPDDVRKEIVFWMFKHKEENKLAVEEFCQNPFAEAFRIYDQVEKGLRNSDKPMGPLYLMSQAKRDFVLNRIIDPWYYSYPRVALISKETIDAMDDDIRLYCKGEEVRTLPYDIEEECGTCLSLLCLAPVLVGGASIGGGAVAGATCTRYGAQCICKMPILNVIFSLSACVGISFGTIFSCNRCYEGFNYSEKKTL